MDIQISLLSHGSQLIFQFSDIEPLLLLNILEELSLGEHFSLQVLILGLELGGILLELLMGNSELVLALLCGFQVNFCVLELHVSVLVQ